MLSVVEYCFRKPACDSSIALLFSAHVCNLIVSMYVKILLVLFIREIPLKFSGSIMLPLLCIRVVGQIIFSHQAGGKSSIQISLNKSFKKGNISFKIDLIISIHIPSGPGERFEWMDFILAITSSSVICLSRSMQSLF